MASSINASTSGAGGVITTADNTGILNLQTASTNAVTIDASQNVGIGTTTPTASIGGLFVSKYVTSSGINFSAGFTDAINNTFRIGHSSGVAQLFTDAAIAFSTNSTERMRIDSSGNVLIGSSTAAGKFYSYNTNNSWGAYVECNSGSLNAGVLALVSSRNTTNNTYKAIVYYNSGAAADRFYVTDGGAVYGTGAYNQISDGRLKENVRDIDVGLSSILNLQPRIFDWKENKGSNTKDNIGFIAQEVENVLPHAVSDWTNSQGDETVYKAVSMESMIPVLVKAIQEQQTIINDLKARVTALEAK